jgi:hypothetical protein
LRLSAAGCDCQHKPKREEHCTLHVVAVPLGTSRGQSVHLEPGARQAQVQRGPCITKWSRLRGKLRSFRKDAARLRSHLVVILSFASLVAAQGCATQDRGTRATEQAAVADSEDDSTCRQRGTPDSEAYEVCRQQRAEARAQAAATQEQRRRDFDRTLGAGTDAQSSF